MAAAKTGTTKANILIARSNAIVIKGKSILLFLSPGMLKVLLVISRFVNDIVVLIPANITETIAISWLPTPENFVFEEKGVTKAQPERVKVLFEHLVK
jgi:hypothetical protein